MNQKENCTNTNSPTLTRASIFVETGDFQRAIEYCEKELDQNPTNCDAYFCLLMAELKISEESKLKEIKGIESRKNFKLAKKFASDPMREKLEQIEAYRKETDEQEKIEQENLAKKRREDSCRLNQIRKESNERTEILKLHLSATKHLDNSKDILSALKDAIQTEMDLAANNDPDDQTVQNAKTKTREALTRSGSLEEKLETIKKNARKNKLEIMRRAALILGILLLLGFGVFVKYKIDQERREIATSMGLVLGKWDTSCLIGFTGALDTCELPDFITKIDIDPWTDSGPNWIISQLTISKNVTSISNESLIGIRKIEVSPENKIFVKGKHNDLINTEEKRLIHLDFTVKEYTIPKSITSVDAIVLHSIKSVKIEHGNENLFLGKSGEIIDKKAKTLVYFPVDFEGDYKIPEEVEHIANSVFFKRSKLKKITIPNHVKTIGYFAFSRSSIDTNELEIMIPDSVEVIKDGAFVNVKKVTLAKGNKNFKIGDKNELIDLKRKTLLYVPNDLSGEYTIPKGIKRIGLEAFSNCKKLKEVKLPEGLETIGKRAFANCSSLENIILSKELKTIGAVAFHQCSSLKEIKLPEGLKTIGFFAFVDSGLEEISLPDSVTTIGMAALNSLKKVKVSPKNKSFKLDKGKVLIDIKKKKIIHCAADFSGEYNVPDDIQVIGPWSFCKSSLEKIKLPKSLIVIEQCAFGLCSGLKEISIPSNVKTIGGGVFINCSNLEKVDLSNGLITIGTRAFSGCKVLKKISIPESVKSIHNFAFQGIKEIEVSSMNKTFRLDQKKVLIDTEKKEIVFCCSDFEGTYQVPKDITKIRPSAFFQCSKLEGITLPEGIETIEPETFNGCSSLKEIKLPKGIKTIWERAFFGCSALKSIDLPEGIETIEPATFNGCSSLKEIKLPKGIKTIGEGAFYNCSNLKSIDLPEGIESIEGYAFSGCIELEKINLPEGIKKIGFSTFSRCIKLKEIMIPDSITEFPIYAFEKNITIKFSPTNKNFKLDQGKVLIDIKNKKIIGCIKNVTGKYVVPDDIEEIGGSAFANSSSLKEIKLPKGLKTIRGSAFDGCYNLEKIDLPEGLKTIESSAFYSCSKLKTINLPEGLETIGSYTFSGCYNLKEISIPASVKEIGGSAFGNVRNIKLAPGNKNFKLDQGKVLIDIKNKKIIGCYGELNGKYVVPDDIEEISPNSFSGNFYLKEIKLPKGLKRIGSCAFSGCSLEEIKLPDGIEVIEYSTFSNCKNLKKVELPKGLKWIDYVAFEGCQKLTEIHIPASVEFIDGSAFSNLKKLYVPGSISDAKIKQWGLPKDCVIERERAKKD